ncbi:phage holin family protein [Flavobacterium agrisoli]|uniref:Phage holin family protein n=1 Tax=Flavobacterium agrisoli TaxID=2793066 RepID=A0A934UIQ3_9FLAO|nr:phage holin family protein [Flavobacterium agrisoli]MBK0369077.1 phage holin family protein [Flavobacterium agrisoli]
METNTSRTEMLFDKAETYAKTSFEIIKLKTVSKTADALSTLTSHIAIGVLVVFFGFFLNIGLSLWIGEQLGASYYGFFIVGGFYFLITLLLAMNRRSWLRKPIGQLILSILLKEDEDNA